MLSLILEWAVVLIPTVVGLVQWAWPVSEPTKRHRMGVLVGCVLFSVLLLWQEREARNAHEREVKELPGQVAAEVVKILPGKTEPVPQGTAKPTAAPPTTSPTNEWQLTPQQLNTLTMRMKFYASRRDRGDLITCVLGNPDSTRLATQLVTAFRNAEWNLPGSGFNQAVYSGMVTGLILKVHSAESRPPGFSEFVQTMREAGIEPTGEINEKLSEGDFQIVVGGKP